VVTCGEDLGRHALQVAKKRGGFTVERGGFDPYGFGDAMGDGGQAGDIDELGDIIKGGVDEVRRVLSLD
jgi:hypothetical protein